MHLDHNGYFCGLKDDLCYVSGTEDYRDNCSTETFSRLWIEEFIKQGGNEIEPRTTVYWLLPRKSLYDGLCLIENDSHILAMMAAVREEKTLCLMVDQTNFFRRLREDVPVQIPSKYMSHTAALHEDGGVERETKESALNNEVERETEESACIPEANRETEDEECDTDSDYDVEDGDDDMFLANIDKHVNNNNEVS